MTGDDGTPPADREGLYGKYPPLPPTWGFYLDRLLGGGYSCRRVCREGVVCICVPLGGDSTVGSISACLCCVEGTGGVCPVYGGLLSGAHDSLSSCAAVRWVDVVDSANRPPYAVELLYG